MRNRGRRFLARFLLLTLIFGCTATTQPVRLTAAAEENESQIISIRDARETAEGETVTVRGVVHHVNGRNLYLQDDTGAIVSYLNSANSEVQKGDLVTTTGKTYSYNGLWELSGATVDEIDHTNTYEYGYREVTADNAASFVENFKDYESEKVLLKEVKLSSFSGTAYAYVKAGDTEITIYGAANIAKLKEFEEGDVLNVFGVVGNYKNACQITPLTSGNGFSEVELVEKAGTTDPDPVDPDPTDPDPVDPVDPDPGEDETITSIADARKADSGTELTVKGVVHHIVSGRTLYIQDDTGAIVIYLTGANSEVKKGDLITATGKTTSYSGLWEVSGATIDKIDAENTKEYGFKTIDRYDAADFVKNHDDYEAQKVLLKGAKISAMNASKSNVTVDLGGTLILIYGSGSYFTDAYGEGDVVDLFGVVGDYNGVQVLLTEGNGHAPIAMNEDGGSDDDLTIDESITSVIAKWAGSAQFTDEVLNGDLYADNDMEDTANTLTLYKGGERVSPGYSTSASNHFIGGTGLTEGDYFEFRLNGKGYGAYHLLYKMQNSATAAKNYQLSYSVNGEDFTTFTGSTKVTWKGSAGEQTETYSGGTIKMPASGTMVEFDIALPKQILHQENVILRLGVKGTEAINGKEIGTGGTTRMRTVTFTGSPVQGEGVTAPVKADPEEGAMRAGDKVALTTATEGATIYYSINGGTTYRYDDTDKVTLLAEDFVKASDLDAEYKAVLTAWAEKDGSAKSVETTYTYTQLKTAAVTAQPSGGAIRLSQPITLRSLTEGAQIVYSLDNGATWEEYTEAFYLRELPIIIQAKATADGCLDSALSTFSYTERENEEYNIYFGQLHSHTNYSDGAGTANDAFHHASAEAEHIDFLAVTDHSNSFDNDTAASITDGSVSSEWREGHELADQYTSDTFVGLFGYEMTWSGGAPGHINTFNTDGFMSRNMPGYESQSRTALQNYYAQLKGVPDSISMFNHPGNTFGDFYDFAYYDEEIDQQITLIEVGNGEGAIGSAGYFPSYEYYTRALDKGWHVAPANNQDNHKGKWGDANTGRSVILADSLTRENIYDAIRNRRLYATEDHDLKIYYTLNGEEMGTILESKPDTVQIKVRTSDASDSDDMKVEVIVNGGLSIASKTVPATETETTFTLSPDYSYYYIRVTQGDKDIAVTAPVWIDAVEAIGVGSMTSDTPLPVAGEPIKITSGFYNNEKADFAISSIVYDLDGEVVHTVNAESDGSGIVLAAKSEREEVFTLNNDKVGNLTLTVTVFGTLNGVSKKYTGSLPLTYIAQDMVTRVIIDGTHRNDYVNGYYGGNVGNFADIAASSYVQVRVEEEKITKEMLENCSLLVISAPSKRTGTFNGVNYGVMHFEDDFIEMVAEYAANGGNLVLCGIADYQDRAEGQSSTEINRILEAIGATTRLNSDELYDTDRNGGQPYRLYLTRFNMDSYLLDGVVMEERDADGNIIKEGQEYSAYSGCSILVDADAVAAGTVTPLVYGHDSTYSIDSQVYGGGYTEIEKGNAVAIAEEKLSGGGSMLVAGTVFLSDFEVKQEIDYAGQLLYANRDILLNFLKNHKKELPITPIAEMRKGEKGEIFTIEGYVTNGTHPHGNAFFDCIYVQDETGGTIVFPVAEDGIERGEKIRITGYVDEYQGDLEIQVLNYERLSAADIKIYEPKELTTLQATDYNTFGGQLVKVEGKVTRIVTNETGVDYFYVQDDSGAEARVFIDGYILASDGNDTVNEDVKVGNTVSAVGMMYINPDGVCLRVRDRSEIIKTADAGTDPGPTDPEDPEVPEIPDGYYRVTFNANGGDGTMAYQDIKYGAREYLQKNTFTKTGYVFDRWALREDGRGATYKDGARVRNLTKAGETVELYAVWKPITFTIRFVNAGLLFPIKVSYGQTVKVGRMWFAPRGYELAGWTTKPGSTTPQIEGELTYITPELLEELGIEPVNGGTITFYALWKRASYKINYVLNGGTLPADAPVTFEAGTGLRTLPTPTREGYTFGGWYRDRTCFFLRAYGISASENGDVTLYAKWTKTRTSWWWFW